MKDGFPKHDGCNQNSDKSYILYLSDSTSFVFAIQTSTCVFPASTVIIGFLSSTIIWYIFVVLDLDPLMLIQIAGFILPMCHCLYRSQDLCPAPRLNFNLQKCFSFLRVCSKVDSSLSSLSWMRMMVMTIHLLGIKLNTLQFLEWHYNDLWSLSVAGNRTILGWTWLRQWCTM